MRTTFQSALLSATLLFFAAAPGTGYSQNYNYNQYYNNYTRGMNAPSISADDGGWVDLYGAGTAIGFSKYGTLALPVWYVFDSVFSISGFGLNMHCYAGGGNDDGFLGNTTFFAIGMMYVDWPADNSGLYWGFGFQARFISFNCGSYNGYQPSMTWLGGVLRLGYRIGILQLAVDIAPGICLGRAADDWNNYDVWGELEAWPILYLQPMVAIGIPF